MDRVFLEYYEDELAHLRVLSQEFAALHPTVARNLALDITPCPDPYIERLLEGVAYLCARTRLKVDSEAPRLANDILRFLYPDLVAQAPATGIVEFLPGGQVDTTAKGVSVPRGTRLISRLSEGLSTRVIYTTSQDVQLWPITITAVEYLQDHTSLDAAGINGGRNGAAAALRLRIARRDGQPLSSLSLDCLDFYFRPKPLGHELFDAIHGFRAGIVARPAGIGGGELTWVDGPKMVGIADGEAMIPPSRPGFEGYRLLREYFINPDRFLFSRIDKLESTIKRCGNDGVDIWFLFDRPCPSIARTRLNDILLFCTPIINLFERDCSPVKIDKRHWRYLLQADRTRTRDYEIYSVTHVEDAEQDGAKAIIPPLLGLDAVGQRDAVYATERLRRRPGEDERRARGFRSSYPGDEVFLTLSSTTEPPVPKKLRRINVRALCTNRDLPIFDPTPELSIESSDPIDAVTLISGINPPRPSLTNVVPSDVLDGQSADDVYWRLTAQLSLNYLSFTGESAARALTTLLRLYADRGDPRMAPHSRALCGVETQPTVERLPIAGPTSFAQGTEVTLDFDATALTGGSKHMLGALISSTLVRYAGINSFLRVKTRLAESKEEVIWPLRLGCRIQA